MYAELAQACGRTEQAHAQLQALQKEMPSIDQVEALIWLEQKDETRDREHAGADHYITHLQGSPSLIAAARWLLAKKLAGDPNQAVVERALQHAVRPLGRYRCAACGFEAQSHYWQCPGCHSWDSYPPRRIEEL